MSFDKFYRFIASQRFAPQMFLKKNCKTQQEQIEGNSNVTSTDEQTTDPDEQTTDQLITVLAERVTSGALSLDISRQLRIKVMSLHETTIFSDQEIVEWCR